MGVNHLRLRLLLYLFTLFVFGQHDHRHAQHDTLASPSIFLRRHGHFPLVQHCTLLPCLVDCPLRQGFPLLLILFCRIHAPVYRLWYDRILKIQLLRK